ncbi:Protein VAPYRIN [Phytophthora ramorum]|uniref:Protein VAPYRIN n=1 Tax=Phytophthora ramorum TaxID=164328 RepID=UPI0030AD67C2|nr:Protein VAPYRIN [Phytophthora ramorum]
MMHEDEDDAKYEEKDVAAKAAPSDEEESDVQSTRNQGSTQREEDSNAGEKSAVSSDERAGESGGATGLSVRADDAKQRRATPELDIESNFHAFSADDDDDEGNYQIVKKSIYKPHRKGFLSRFAPVASTKQKYLSEITGIVTGEEVEAAKDCEEKGSGNIDLAIEEEEEDDIQVSIDRSAHTPRRSRGSHDRRRLSAEDAALGGPSEVVIHSGDSDLGFATLNPIINSNAQRSAPNHGDFVAPAMTKSTGVPVAKAKPILLEIPVAEQATPARDRLLLIINALGATGLPKAEKFGTQSCFLEMRLFDDTNVLDASSTTSWSSYLMRTELHKKGGSEAQWNQQFTTTLRSKETQFLHVDVKTSSKILVGEANVPLDKVGDLFYDQHYPLFRSEDNDENSNDLVLLSAGQVHLQLKIVDTVAVSLPPTVIPPLQLPLFTSLESTQSGVKSPLTAKPIPAVLLNGGLFFKIPYHSHNMIGYANGLRRQWVAVRRATDPPHLQITWGDPTLSGSAERKSLRSLDLALVAEIREGNTTAAFAAQTESNIVKEKDKCFSLVTRARTLDLVAASKEEARIWINNLRELLFASEKSVDASLLSARTIEAYKQSALSPREQEDSSGMKATPAVAPTKRMVAAWRNRIFNLARHDKVDDVMECLEDGCPIDLLESGSGDTLLMLACRLGNAELVELCLSRRAKNDPHPEFGETALQVAVNSSHAHCVGLLLSTAAKSDMDSEIVNHIDPNNDAPLHVAGRHGDLACLQLLLHHGADICVVEEFGRTPLHCAVANGNLDCVAYLLDVGGDSVLNSGDHDGDTALHYAALSGNEAIVKLLLESAANVFATNVQKETAYDIAVREKQQRCAELISKYFLTNEKEGSSASLTWNEPASTLLGRLKHEQTAVVFRDNGRVVEEEFVEKIPSASFVHSEVWKPEQNIQTIDYEDDYETYPVKHRSSMSGEPSKYEARTGFRLSVDIKAPPAEDVSRPTLVPSPRSKSPIKKFLEGAEEDATSGSFGKSRASSPRGRSKNIQLIELKRANNLALALASFKIHDHYEQIVNDIVKMDERVVNPALLGCLQRFFPTEKEKQALQSFNGSISTLGKAERFFCLLFQVPGMQERIDMFLYKMEFTRTHSSLLARILIVKRACRDLVENFSFIQALERFFKKQKMTSFSVFQDNKTAFISEHLSEADEKLRSFRGDLGKAMGVELVELQLQMNRLVAGIRPIRSFVNRSPSSTSGQSEDRDGKARDILHRFLVDTRSLLSEIETEFEAMELWGDKLLAVFGESKATFQISAILHAVVELL